MFDLRAKLAMAQEYLIDGTFNGARYYGACHKYMRQHIPGVEFAGVRALRQEGLLTDYAFADALELLAQQQVTSPSFGRQPQCHVELLGPSVLPLLFGRVS